MKALTQFPTVLDNMTKNLSWTSALGEAYHTQAADVMSAIQFLRAKAKAAGNLKSGSQITVVEQSPQTIVIQSANPQVVYVPTYNPAVVYGTPYVYPGYSTGAMIATGMFSEQGSRVPGTTSGGCCGWGYSSLNCGWHSTTVVYRGAYYGNAAWHGGYYGGAVHYGVGITQQPGPTRVEPQPTTVTAVQALVKPTIHPRELMRRFNLQCLRSAGAAQAYNPILSSASTVQGSNANGSWGIDRFEEATPPTVRHQTTAQGTTGSIQTLNGGKAVCASGQ